ncbi:TfuA-like protein [Streptomyces sp. M41]|uniref:TfuA-like protein n=1 Tax=Streptomyces sp. M41 TaxID=3059412 RepID=UPI00374D0D37
MAVHVFVGPSCPEPLVRQHHPDVVVHGPVRHGDLFPRMFAAGDVVVIVDGIYHHRLALRHKEILDALSRGVSVLGAASIGALRAAELDRSGMTGVGRIYGWYRDGVFDGDDAVSVAHGETGSLTGLNVPLVNLYTAVMTAQEAGVLTPEAVRDLMRHTEREYYPLRTRERILAVARERGQNAFADWYAEHLAADPAAFDQKRADALEALALAERLHSRAPQTTSPPSTTGRPRTGRLTGGTVATTARDWRTEYHRRWRNAFAPDDSALRHRVAYQQIFAEDFPDTWWEYLRRHTPAAPDGAARGLRDHVLHHLGPAAGDWYDDPAMRPRITALLCPLPDLTDPDEVKLLLRHESAEDRARVTEWLELTRRHLDAHPERSLTQISDATCARLLRLIRRVDTDAALLTQCARRGLPSLSRAALALRPFALGCLSSLKAPAPVGGEAHA